MATYSFKCKKCNKEEDRTIPINDYDKEKNNQYCSCGGKMERTFQDIGGTEYRCTGMYDTDNRGARFR